MSIFASILRSVYKLSGKANAFFAPESLYTLRKIDAKILMIQPPHFRAVMQSQLFFLCICTS